MISLSINGKFYNVPKDITVFQACQQVGINIPSLCYDERLEPEASCNLCVVEIEGRRELVTSCSTKVEEGMKIQTQSNKVIASRKEVLNSLLMNRPYAFSNCYKLDGCKLHDYCNEYGIFSEIDVFDKEQYPIDDSSLFYYIDPNKCIKCNLCIRVCEELQGKGCLDYDDEGNITKKPTFGAVNSEDNECEECGNCISVCPTGALVPKQFLEEFAELQETEISGQKSTEPEELRNIKTTCSYCGVGCQMELVVKNDHVVDVKPVNVLPNKGLLCVKGRFGYKFINHPDRLKTPLIKKDGKFVKATWEEAYSLITEKAKKIKGEHGGEVFGGLSSARCTNEENYLFQKLIRGAFGSNNIDHCARL